MPCPRLSIQNQDDLSSLVQKLKERQEPDTSVESTVAAIISEVEADGDATLVKYTAKFDCRNFSLSHLKVDESDIRAAEKAIPADDLAILKEAARNIRNFHEAQVEQSWWTTKEDGSILGQLVRPLDRAGLYVPGGQGGETPLISSILMNAIPAQVAGVESICIVSPPRADGTLNPYILAAASLLDITEVYAVGSAWAVAALALGTETIQPVDIIAGPGNIFVTTAKRLLMGRIAIDMVAGPSEIAILCDHTANPAWVAADMLSQAEHDTLAASIVVTTDQKVADAVCVELEKQLADLPRNEIAAKSLKDWGMVVTAAGMETAVTCINTIAPEHLEVITENGWELIGKIRHAGAIFLGPNSPEPVGDYFAGPNHVLPTMGTARFSQALSVENFRKKTSLLATSGQFVQENAEKIARLARLEGLEAHARSVLCRKQ